MAWKNGALWWVRPDGDGGHFVLVRSRSGSALPSPPFPRSWSAWAIDIAGRAHETIYRAMLPVRLGRNGTAIANAIDRAAGDGRADIAGRS